MMVATCVRQTAMRRLQSTIAASALAYPYKTSPRTVNTKLVAPTVTAWISLDTELNPAAAKISLR
jgi:hypothetical protein